jgi:hypothetical protein
VHLPVELQDGVAADDQGVALEAVGDGSRLEAGQLDRELLRVVGGDRRLVDPGHDHLRVEPRGAERREPRR